MKPAHTLALALATAFAAACGGAQTTTVTDTPKVDDMVKPTPDDPGSKPAPDVAAKEEVARLAALADANPLLAAWSGPHGGVPPWDKIKAEDFPAAFEISLPLLLAEIEVIAQDPASPTFENTFVPMENAGRHHDRGETLFSVMTSSLNSKEVQAVDTEWAPKITAAYDKITFNDKLFARIAAIYEARAASGLSPEQQRLVELTYDRFVRAGAKLTPDEKARVGKINEELSALFTEFGNKVQADENSWIVLETDKDLAGLSDSLRAGYKAAADERGLTGKWAVVNTRSAVDPFLTSSSRRDLREKVWKAFKSRGDNGGANDTNATIARIVKLRAERAKLLGYPTHAHWRMADTMAKDPAKAKAADDARVAGGGRARPRGGRRHEKIAKREGSRRRSSRGTTSTTPRRCARRSTTSIRTSSSRTSS